MDEQQKRNHLGRQLRLNIDSIYSNIEKLIWLSDTLLGQWRVHNFEIMGFGLESLQKRAGRTLNEISDLKTSLKKAEEYADFKISFTPLQRENREEIQRERIAMGKHPERYVTAEYTNVYHRSIYNDMESIIDLLEPLLAKWEIGNLAAVEYGLRLVEARFKRTREDLDELMELKSSLKTDDYSTTVSSG